MWHYVEISNPDDEVVGACFIEPFAGGAHVAVLTAELRGWVSIRQRTRVIPLPGLIDQIPKSFLDRFLTVEDLRRLDRYCGGDGTGTIPASEREVPWL